MLSNLYRWIAYRKASQKVKKAAKVLQLNYSTEKRTVTGSEVYSITLDGYPTSSTANLSKFIIQCDAIYELAQRRGVTCPKLLF